MFYGVLGISSLFMLFFSYFIEKRDNFFGCFSEDVILKVKDFVYR